MSVAFRDINHSFGRQEILHGVSLNVADGEILCLLGPSGSGKTTLLRLAAGLETLQAGVIEICGETVADAHAQHAARVQQPPEDRSVGLVFQDHVLYPHMTVAQNVGFGLSQEAPPARTARVADMLETVGLTAFAQRYPHTLSGGQQQRVALARALARSPALMLLDEPFASVDSNLRRRLQAETRLQLKAAGTTTIVVTHDASEALALGDRIAYLEAGRLVQQGTPQELWRRPATLAVATALLEVDAFPVTVTNSEVRSAFGVFARDAFVDQRSAAGVDAIAVLRPYAVALQLPVRNEAPVTLADRRFASQGEQVLLRSAAAPDAPTLALTVSSADQILLNGPAVLALAPRAGFLFDPT